MSIPTPSEGMSPREQIDAILANIAALFEKATAIADTHGESFFWDQLGYGMGGHYRPKTLSYNDAIEFIESGKPLDPDMRIKIVKALQKGRDEETWESSDESGWVSSSSQC